MGYKGFDKYASEYDAWFMENENVLESEVRLVAYCMKSAGAVLSVGCGSGLFEKILADRFAIHINNGIEPAPSMAEIARKRGVNVVVDTAEEADFGEDSYDTILFNGCPGYIANLRKAFEKAYHALRMGGRIVVIDVPKESSYGLLYNLALSVGSWSHPLLDGVRPRMPYPIELVTQAAWRTTAEKVDLLLECGFGHITFAQTLTRHPLYSHIAPEDPVDGCDKGDYVSIMAIK